VAVDALNDRAARFYQANGFRQIPDGGRLVLRVRDIVAVGGI
jgi:hypothetical protein